MTEPHDDRYDLHRFVAAQRGIFEHALAELHAGIKRTHWMWFVFPQIAGLGGSAMAMRYAIRSLSEATAYLAEQTLGPRYLTCVDALREIGVPDPVAVFGSVDAMKLRSSLTLFEAAGGPDAIGATIDRWFAGSRDPATLRIIADD